MCGTCVCVESILCALQIRSRYRSLCVCVVYIKCVLVQNGKTIFFICTRNMCVLLFQKIILIFLYFSLSHNITSLVTYNFYLNNTDGFFSLICSNASFVEYGVRVTGSR